MFHSFRPAVAAIVAASLAISPLGGLLSERVAAGSGTAPFPPGVATTAG